MQQQLFDNDALNRADQRRQRQALDGDFMRLEIADRMADRLLDIRRDFADKLDLGGRFTQPGYAPVVLQDVLDVEQESADLFISNLQLHNVNDPVGLLIQARLALRPDGFFLASMFGGETLYELREVLLEAEIAVTGGASQRIHPMGDVRDLGGLLSRAGFALPVADVDRITVSYEHPLKLMADLRAMGEVNCLTDRSRKFLRRDVLLRACELYQERYTGPDGRITATFDVIYLSAWCPHPDQPKPLRPGSASASLADALDPNKKAEGK